MDERSANESGVLYTIILTKGDICYILTKFINTNFILQYQYKQIKRDIKRSIQT